MKKIILVTAFLLFAAGSLYAQLPYDYPFKTYVDNNGNLYVTGGKLENPISANTDIWLAKYVNGVKVIDATYPNYGYDMGHDLTVDEDGNIYITGYIYGSEETGNDIIFLKYDISEGLFTPTVFGDALDDRGYGISYDGEDIYVCGYVTSATTGKDVVALKFLKAGLIDWNEIYNKNDDYVGEDVATHIFHDQGYIYVAGYYTHPGNATKDILLVTYGKELAEPEGFEMTQSTGDQVLTDFFLTDVSQLPTRKSKGVLSGWDRTGSIKGKTYEDYLTIYFDSLAPSTNNTPRWIRNFGTQGATDVATACTKGSGENVLVTGYSYNGTNSYDFATSKYGSDSGNLIWTIYYDSLDGIDKASNIRVDTRGNIVVSGYSEHTEHGYVIQKFRDPGPAPVLDWAASYQPVFSELSSPNAKYSSFLHTDTSGNIYLFMFTWDDIRALYEVVKYDSSGNILYTIEGDEDQPRNISVNEWSDFKLEQNYPNPFNPETMISYSLPSESYVRLNVYDAVGKEVAVLVSSRQQKGVYTAVFNGSSLPSGVYFYRLNAVNDHSRFVRTSRMILVK